MCKPETEFLRLGRTIFKVIFPTKLTFLLLSSISISAYSQIIQSEDLKTEIQEETAVKISFGKSIDNLSNNSSTCLMTQSEFFTLKNNSNQIIKSHINLTLGKPSDIKLIPNDFFENDFKCFTESTEGIAQITIDKGTHFQGSINNDPNSSISMSIVGDQIQGLMYTSYDNQYLIHSESTVDHAIFIYFDRKTRNQTHAFDCGTDDWLHYIDNKSDLQSRTKESCKRAKISVRADYDLYLKFNKNPQLVTNYITTLFNQINTIYRREEIQISLSEIIINITPDGFKHISSNLDLNYLKSNYKSFNGNVQICLSGFNNKGIANLGGVAYVNSLCVKTYAYAYANVEGKTNDLPNFSYDVFLTAHELGHVFGSRHTHACVWGPNKNQAIDNCAPVEGSCIPGPKPIKGSLMSYCHLAGNNGIDLMLGFGTEPGDLIRSNVNKATCLSNYTPSTQVLNKKDQHLIANVECFDGIYSNYYFDNNTIDENDDILLASIKKNGQDIGTLKNNSLIIKAHTTKSYGSGTAQDLPVSYSSQKSIISNRYWEINSNQPITTELNIKLYFSPIDLKEIQKCQSNTSIEKLSIIEVNESGDANPDNKHLSINKTNLQEYINGPTASKKNWQLTKNTDGNFAAEFQTLILNDFGLIRNRANNFNDNLDSRINTSMINVLNLSPQPATSDKITLYCNHNFPQTNELIIEILSFDGQLMLKYTVQVESGKNNIQLPIETLENGLYLLRCTANDEIHSIKLIISK